MHDRYVVADLLENRIDAKNRKREAGRALLMSLQSYEFHS